MAEISFIEDNEGVHIKVEGSLTNLSAMITMSMVDNKLIEHIILISAAYHMHRNGQFFNAEGIMNFINNKQTVNE